MGALSKRFHDFRAFLFSRKGAAVFKGTLAYIIAFLLLFLKGFDRLNPYPITFNGIILITIAGQPGKSVGEVVQSFILAALGVLVGSLNFFILAKLSHWIVPQAIVFAFMIYLIALVKAQGLMWFAFSLLAILMTFNGVYTSLLLGGVFSPAYLKAYIESYMWGFAIVLFVNICVFPVSSEKELRKTLVTSLQHVGTFAHLLAKSYSLTLTEEEKVVRDRLAQSIRADFGFLSQKIGGTSVEINWSRWSMNDYQNFVASTRSMQLSLISTYSSLVGVKQEDYPLFKATFLPSTVTSFTRLRKDVSVTIREIQNALGCPGMNLPKSGYDEFFDVEVAPSQQAIDNSDGDPSENSRPADDQLAEQLRTVSAKLEAEADAASSTDKGADGDDEGGKSADGTNTFADSPITPMTPAPAMEKTSTLLGSEIAVFTGCARALRRHWEHFRNVQTELITEALVSGKLAGPDKSIRITQPSPSIWDAYGDDHIRGRESPMHFERTPLKRRRPHPMESSPATPSTVPEKSPAYPTSEPASPEEQPEDRLRNNHSLIRVLSLIYSLSQFVDTLEGFHSSVKKTSSGGRFRSKRLHIHIFEKLRQSHTKPPTNGEGVIPEPELSMKEALALLEGRRYVPEKLSVWQYLNNLEHWLRSPNSIYAAKTAAATSVFGILLWAPTTRAWFQNYGLTGGLLTVVVALTPTLGQSIRTFVLQIAGSSIGYLWGLACLEIFKNVGGYRFNPFGIICLVGLYAIPLEYLLYEKPAYFTLVLLALNATGIIITTEWVYTEYTPRPGFDRPPFRLGKGLTALAVGLLVVFIFQLLVLRNPARRTLRKAMASIVYSNLSYNTILQAYVRATIPVDPEFRAPEAAVKRVRTELMLREINIQSQLINARPLVMWAKDEPQMIKPFRGDIVNSILRSNQIILDRMRESRIAIGTEPFSRELLEGFVGMLTPYRRRAMRFTKASFYLCAAALASKLPLMHDTPQAYDLIEDMTHDALLVSSRFAQTEAGKKSIESGEFTRYWFYILSITSIGDPLNMIEENCKQLFGELEDDPHLV